MRERTRLEAPSTPSSACARDRRRFRARRVGRGREATRPCSPTPRAPAGRRERRGRQARARDAAVGRGRRQRRLCRDQRRRRRHRVPGLGRACCRACTRAGPSAHGYKVSLLEETGGEQAGIKSCDLQGRGPERLRLAEDRSRACTGWCASAPFDGNARRHTSFASVWVYPEVDDNIDIEINPTRTCASTPTARRAPAASTSTRPTAPCASPTSRPSSPWPCQKERSQHQNRSASRFCSSTS